MGTTQAARKPVGGRRPLDDPEPSLQYKHRGIYETARFTAARLWFTAIRVATTTLIYSILVDPSTSWSIFNLLPTSFHPSKRPSTSADTLQTWPVNTIIFESLSLFLDMSRSAAVVFLMTVCISVQFITYTLRWRREFLPMTGDGAALIVGFASSVLDLGLVLIYVYLSPINPTWSPALFSLTPVPFVIGFLIQFSADEQKHRFKIYSKNKGQILQHQLWGIVRAPNYTGFMLWRMAQGLATGGWLLGMFFASANFLGWRNNSAPSIEQHMRRKYGEKKYTQYESRVKYRLVPWVY